MKKWTSSFYFIESLFHMIRYRKLCTILYKQPSVKVLYARNFSVWRKFKDVMYDRGSSYLIKK